MLFRIVKDEKGLEWQELVVPKSHRELAFKGIHNEAGHYGYQATTPLARQ